MSKKPKVLLVGGMGYNIPDELRAAVDIVKHIEQGTRKLADLPAVEFILVISEFASHNIVETVKNEAQAPIVYLRKGWASMKEELMKRCILPPAITGQEATGTTALVNPETGTVCGLSEDEIWKTYRQKFVEAVKGALLPRELIIELDLLEILAMVGVPIQDCALILPRLQMGGVIDCPKDGYWRSLMGGDGFDFGDADPMAALPAPPKKPRAKSAFNSEKVKEADERAGRLRGLPFGPYPTKRSIARKMLDYEEWNPGGQDPASINARDRLIERAIALRIIDDTQKNLFIDHDPTMGLKSVVPQDPPEDELPIPLPISPTAPPVLLAPLLPEPPPPDERELAREREEFWATETQRRWPEVVEEVKKQKRMIGTILESCRFKWLDIQEKIAVVLVPAEFSMYRLQLESTENWGLVSKVAKEILGNKVAVRFLMANGISR